MQGAGVDVEHLALRGGEGFAGFLLELHVVSCAVFQRLNYNDL